MTPNSAQLLASGPDLELDEFVASFESAYSRDPAADLAAFLPAPGHPRYVDVLTELVRIDLEFAWGRGEQRAATYYRQRFPALFGDPARWRVIVGEEMRLRSAAEVEPDEADRTKRVSAVGSDKGNGLIPRASTLSRGAHSERAPQPGEQVAGFVLKSELGRGAFARVFLARQADLADRPVVVKVSSRFPGESRTLARLQHAGIVPVYSVHRHGHFHVVCMPFLGATTLADLICEYRAAGRLPTSGQAVVDTLSERAARTAVSGVTGENDPAPEPPRKPEFPPAVRDLYARSSYVELVLWLGAELASGLAHAHERGILHRDVKPANVLLTDEGRPMLLDFNLAADAADVAGSDGSFGGTPLYMAPEQLAGMLRPGTPTDARADVYSLALVLYELLTGRLPFAGPSAATPQSYTSLREARLREPADIRLARPDASPAVAAIFRKALAPDAARRYQSAADFHDDLQRQLDHRPLRFAPDRSPRERLRKWSARHPRLSSWVTVSLLATALLAGVSGGLLARQRNYDRLAAENRVVRLAEARDEVRGLLADRGGPSAELRAAAERCRGAVTDVPATGGDRARELTAELYYFLARAEWLLAQREPDSRGGHLSAAVEANNAAWTLYSDADRPATLQGQRRLIGKMQNHSASADEVPGGAQFAPGEENDAAEARRLIPVMTAAVPNEAGRASYWLTLGRLHRTAGDPASARAFFQLAADRDRVSPWPHYHDGLACLDVRDYRGARAAFDRVIARTADVPEAFLNRAIARVELRDYAGAIADLDQIASHARRLPRLFFVRETAKRRAGDSAGADRDRAAGLRLEPTDAAGFNARGEAKLALSPPDAAGALADFADAVAADPDFRQAYENQAAVLAEHLNRPADALAVLDRAVERFPKYTLARSGRAVLLARMGKAQAARKDADAAVAQEPSPLICYQAACAYLLTATDAADRATGLSLLRRALRQDPSWSKHMPADPDLKTVRDDADFHKLIQAAGELLRDGPAAR